MKGNLNRRQKAFAVEFAATFVEFGWHEARKKAKELYSNKQYYRLMKNDSFYNYLSNEINKHCVKAGE